jgi:hypothetical protein
VNYLKSIVAFLLFFTVGGCALQVGPPSLRAPDIRRVAPEQAERLYSVMVPLLAAMNDPRRPSGVRVGPATGDRIERLRSIA